jgi:hypothetical protein
LVRDSRSRWIYEGQVKGANQAKMGNNHWPLAGQWAANEKNWTQLRAPDSNNTREQQMSKDRVGKISKPPQSASQAGLCVLPPPLATKTG